MPDKLFVPHGSAAAVAHSLLAGGGGGVPTQILKLELTAVAP